MQIGPQLLRHETCKKKKKKFRRIRRRFQGAVRFRRLIRRLNRRIYSFGPRCRFLPFTNKSEWEPAACFSLRISSDSASEGCASAAQSCTHFPEKKNPSIIGHFFQQMARWNPVSQMALLVIGQISTKLSAAALAARYKRHGRFTAAQKTWTWP